MNNKFKTVTQTSQGNQTQQNSQDCQSISCNGNRKLVLNPQLQTHIEPKTKGKKGEAYFDFLRDQLQDQRSIKIFQQEPSLIGLGRRDNSLPMRIIGKRTEKQNRRVRAHSLENYVNSFWTLLGSKIGMKQLATRKSKKSNTPALLQRSGSCVGVEAGQRPTKLKMSDMIPIRFYCAQQKREFVRRRFRKYVLGVRIVLHYKKNMKKILKKRIQRISVRQQAILALHNPTPEQKKMQSRILQYIIPNLSQRSRKQSISSSDSVQLLNFNGLQNQPKAPLYFKSAQPSSKLLSNFLSHHEGKKSVVSDHSQGSLKSFQTLDEFQKKLKKKKSQSVAKLPKINEFNATTYQKPKLYPKTVEHKRLDTDCFKSEHQAKPATSSTHRASNPYQQTAKINQSNLVKANQLSFYDNPPQNKGKEKEKAKSQKRFLQKLGRQTEVPNQNHQKYL